MNALFAQVALLPNGWAHNVHMQWDAAGILTKVSANNHSAPENLPSVELLIPGMPNLHSHAFQRAMAGLTEYRSSAEDSFWSWRTLMYAFARKLNPELLKAVASQLYLEMLKAGYTSTCEFHYIHHAPNGQPYATPEALSTCLIEAANEVGMGLTLLPVMYEYSGFGKTPPHEGQKRFINDPHWIMSLLDRLQTQFPQHAGLRYGVAPHSLRAVCEPTLQTLVNALTKWSAQAPIHIHIAEQTKEVEDCLTHLNQRPVEWLLNHFNVNERWCLVHATHMTPQETRNVAKSGAIVGICPSTEANLGDGIFNGVDYLNANGAWGIGSDSHITVDVAEELRLYEYSQRLSRRQRNVLASNSESSVGHYLYTQALAGGAQASARPIRGFAPGQRADALVLNASHPDLFGKQKNQILDSFVFSRHGDPLIQSVLVGGQWRIQNGAHQQEANIAQAYRTAMTSLLA
ncbi:formimidoylglutamate deiminase [Neopusillimonas maritima]|uniref:Formimidoylglutamate deiminase n=1 Tax=Neopusillimonas maritima TaxID=2026239 RepID=A0ABX9MUY9_9BURK|nr:formimidoylglutamate deiminase [Neopusillimonas maritima]MBF23102.1 formimidoylglutamate deiminase [Pusillimonas sp.]RII82740.1 formimidoylglutamate deiminase [Neopusillimonas maritima]|tara:strand:+ start:346 stop:1725 length:1380 start_codon:yes stop_codon:yes gene_type:complete